MKSTKSLYDIISAAYKDGGLPRDFSLPPQSDAKIPFADGAADGIGIYHMGPPEITDEIRAGIKSAVTAASDGDFKRAEELFHTLSGIISAIRAIDELQSYIIENKDSLNAENLYKCAVYMMTESTNRECVKFGISMLELFNIEDNEELKSAVEKLGLCNEFTVFAVFVMQKWTNANEHIFRLAQHVHGWGRIHAVERLEPETDEIKIWLLRDGVNNEVLPAYSALTCWEKSGAAELLNNPNLSDEDFAAILNLVDELLDEGPCPGISEVENSAEVVARVLDIAKNRNLNADGYAKIRNIRISFEEENPEIAAKCSGILNTENCRLCVEFAVKSGEAIPLAKELGIDFRPDVLKLLENDFDDKYYLCRYLMDDEYRAKTIEIFCKNLPLDEMKTAPTTDMPIGRNFQIHNKLDMIVQDLDTRPLEGLDLVETALQCAPVRNRNVALHILQSWVNIKGTPLETLLPETYSLIKEIVKPEPNDETRKMMEKLLNGEIDENSDE